MVRFLVRAGSVNAVRRALGRAPGGVRVVGRYDRETIECVHTMDERSLARHWPVIVSRLAKDGLSVVEKKEAGGSSNPPGRGSGEEPGEGLAGGDG